MGKSILTSAKVAGSCVVSESGGSVAGTLEIGAGVGISWATEGENEAPSTQDRLINWKRQAKLCMLPDYPIGAGVSSNPLAQNGLIAEQQSDSFLMPQRSIAGHFHR
jgi:hypothetical protein